MAEKPRSPLMPSAQEHCCEICGMADLSDDTMREHMKSCHIDGSAVCPFCGLNGVAPAELLLHVNQAHLDYLTPENEMMSFIDEQSPSVDDDSDSLSEFRDMSPMKSPMTDQNTASISFKLNGYSHSFSSNGQPGRIFGEPDNMSNNKINRNCLKHVDTSHMVHTDCYSVAQKDSEMPNGSHGSPLRSQLGLNLKKNHPISTTTASALKSPNLLQVNKIIIILLTHSFQ